MGPTSDFKAQEMRLYSFWADSVGQLMDQADRMRWQETAFKEMLLEAQARSTLIPEYVAFIDEREKVLKNQSTFGPGFNRQRNHFIRRTA